MTNLKTIQTEEILANTLEELLSAISSTGRTLAAGHVLSVGVCSPEKGKTRNQISPYSTFYVFMPNGFFKKLRRDQRVLIKNLVGTANEGSRDFYSIRVVGDYPNELAFFLNA